MYQCARTELELHGVTDINTDGGQEEHENTGTQQTQGHTHTHIANMLSLPRTVGQNPANAGTHEQWVQNPANVGTHEQWVILPPQTVIAITLLNNNDELKYEVMDGR